MKNHLLKSAAVLIAAASPAAVRAADIVDTAVGAGKFKTLVTAVKAAGLVETLKGRGPFTVFAPTDAAFKRVPPATLKSLLKDKAKLTSVLTYHVVPGRVLAKDAIGVTSAATVNGQRLDVKFAGGKLTVDGANVVATDIVCDNGVIHVIDKVMLPSLETIPATAARAGKFKTLLAAVTAAGLADALGTKGPFTVFAPTDDAFGELPAGTLETLLKPENKDKLTAILKYHVVKGRVFAADAVKAREAKTLLGRTVTAGFGGGGLTLNGDVNVVAADIECANGVVHVIDRVLIPKTLTSADARELFEEAVRVGSGKYNAGDRRGCAELYERACRECLEAGGDLPSGVRAVLSGTLRRSRGIRHDGERAWALRQGIEMSYSILAREGR